MINLTLISAHAEDYETVDYGETQVIYCKVSVEKVEEKRLLGFMLRYVSVGLHYDFNRS